MKKKVWKKKKNGNNESTGRGKAGRVKEDDRRYQRKGNETVCVWGEGGGGVRGENVKVFEFPS